MPPREVQADLPEMPLFTHLTELRSRTLRAAFAAAVVFVPVYAFANTIYTAIATPLLAHLPAGSGMIATDVASPFLTPFKLAVYAALYLAMPLMLHQIWTFVSPGLYRRERRFAIALLSCSSFLFYAGTAFAYFLVFPAIFAFFAATTPAGVTMMTDIQSYLSFVVRLFFAFGLAFQMPVATILLCWSGLATPATLARARAYVFVGCFAAATLLTPPDVISQVLLAVPAWLLFETGVACARVHGRFTRL